MFSAYRVDEQLTKALDRKVWLPSGGSLVIDRTEAMIVVDVNTGKFVGKGGNLEETVTKNNLEAAEEVVRQLRLRDLGGIIVIDFIDMVLESNRELVLRRLMECLGRDRTKHQVAEVTSLGLVQMTRKRVGQGLLESFSETCPTCQGRGFIVHMEHGAPDGPERADDGGSRDNGAPREGKSARTGKGGRDRAARSGAASVTVATVPDEAPRAAAAAAIAKIAAATLAHNALAAEHGSRRRRTTSVAEVVAPASPPVRRGRRGASAPAGAPTPVAAAEVEPVDVVAGRGRRRLPDYDSPSRGHATATRAPAASLASPQGRLRPLRRRLGRCVRQRRRADRGRRRLPTTPQPSPAPVPVAAAGPRRPLPQAAAPRRRRAASRPAGPAQLVSGSCRIARSV